MKFSANVCLFLCTFLSLAQEFSSGSRVAIIGSGIGGSSAAHFLRQLQPDVEIVVFEKHHEVGGRMAVIDIQGQPFEAGGAILHPRNVYMKNFTQILGKLTQLHGI